MASKTAIDEEAYFTDKATATFHGVLPPRPVAAKPSRLRRCALVLLAIYLLTTFAASIVVFVSFGYATIVHGDFLVQAVEAIYTLKDVDTKLDDLGWLAPVYVEIPHETDPSKNNQVFVVPPSLGEQPTTFKKPFWQKGSYKPLEYLGLEDDPLAKPVYGEVRHIMWGATESNQEKKAKIFSRADDPMNDYGSLDELYKVASKKFYSPAKSPWEDKAMPNDASSWREDPAHPDHGAVPKGAVTHGLMDGPQ